MSSLAGRVLTGRRGGAGPPRPAAASPGREDQERVRRIVLSRPLPAGRAAVPPTSLTTAAGLPGMNFSAAPPFRGLCSGEALGAAGLLSLTFLPAWLAVAGLFGLRAQRPYFVSAAAVGVD